MTFNIMSTPRVLTDIFNDVADDSVKYKAKYGNILRSILLTSDKVKEL